MTTPKKIVITGIGASTPLGGTAPESWAALLAGESGASTIEHDWVAEHDLPVTFASPFFLRSRSARNFPFAMSPMPKVLSILRSTS